MVLSQLQNMPRSSFAVWGAEDRHQYFGMYIFKPHGLISTAILIGQGFRHNLKHVLTDAISGLQALQLGSHGGAA